MNFFIVIGWYRSPHSLTQQAAWRIHVSVTHSAPSACEDVFSELKNCRLWSDPLVTTRGPDHMCTLLGLLFLTLLIVSTHGSYTSLQCKYKPHDYIVILISIRFSRSFDKFKLSAWKTEVDVKLWNRLCTPAQRKLLVASRFLSWIGQLCRLVQ